MFALALYVLFPFLFSPDDLKLLQEQILLGGNFLMDS